MSSITTIDSSDLISGSRTDINTNKGKKFPFKERPKAKGRKVWNKGIKMSDDSRKKMSTAKLGTKLSKEHKQKISKSLIGNKRSLGIKASTEVRHRMSEAKKGEKSYCWKGGVTPINKIIRRSLEYRLWRTAVFERDNYTCIWCGTKKSPFNADHIKPFCNYPELRFAIDNGRTLCVPCHQTTETFGNKKKSQLEEFLTKKI